MTETTGVGGGRPRRPDAPQPSPRSVPEWRSFGFTVTEMTDGPARLRADGTGLSVHFDDAGVTVGDERGQRQVTPWSDVRRVWVGPPAEGPTGRSVTPMEIETATGTVRLVADVDGRTSIPLAALDRCLQWWSPVVGPGTAGRSERRHRRTGRARPARRRRTAVLVAGLVLVAAGIGLAFGLGRSGTNGGPVDASPAAPSSADQHLAQRIMLTEGDLPVGWKVDPEPSTSGDSSSQRGQAAITRAFAGCMGVGSQQAAALLGGASADQTAQSTSPIFVAPTAPDDQGYTVQLQTAASIVRSHRDEQTDLRLLDSHRYPVCAATATASELQLGVDDASGAHDHPGRATGMLFTVPGVPGEQVTALRVTCQVSDHGTAVPVEVDAVFLGSDRIEADLEAFAIGGPVPAAVVRHTVQAFEERVASGGRDLQI
jgi:hypothetical protein